MHLREAEIPDADLHNMLVADSQDVKSDEVNPMEHFKQKFKIPKFEPSNRNKCFVADIFSVFADDLASNKPESLLLETPDIVQTS
jgi:hypothetical protein